MAESGGGARARVHKELGPVVGTGGVAGGGYSMAGGIVGAVAVAEASDTTGAGGAEGAGVVAGSWGVAGAGDEAIGRVCIVSLGRGLRNRGKFAFSGCLPKDAKRKNKQTTKKPATLPCSRCQHPEWEEIL